MHGVILCSTIGVAKHWVLCAGPPHSNSPSNSRRGRHKALAFNNEVSMLELQGVAHRACVIGIHNPAQHDCAAAAEPHPFLSTGALRCRADHTSATAGAGFLTFWIQHALVWNTKVHLCRMIERIKGAWRWSRWVYCRGEDLT